MADTELPEQHITVSENGPYLVSGGLALSEQTIGIDQQDNAWTWLEGDVHEAGGRYALCRFGQSGNKPFCDGSHQKLGFDGTETASRERHEDGAQTIDGPTMSLSDNEPLCLRALL